MVGGKHCMIEAKVELQKINRLLVLSHIRQYKDTMLNGHCTMVSRREKDRLL